MTNIKKYYVLVSSINHHDILRTYLNIHGPRFGAPIKYPIFKFEWVNLLVYCTLFCSTKQENKFEK